MLEISSYRESISCHYTFDVIDSEAGKRVVRLNRMVDHKMSDAELIELEAGLLGEAQDIVSSRESGGDGFKDFPEKEAEDA